MRIHSKLRLAILAVALLAGGVVVTAVIYEESEIKAEQHSQYQLTPDECALLKPGDIVLRRGYGLVSRMIATKLEGRYALSHCGVVVEVNSKLHVVHCLSSDYSEIDGVQAHELQAFIKQSRPGSVVVNRLNDSTLHQPFVNAILRYLNEQRKFDHDFDIFENEAIYCSELVWLALKDAANLDVYEDLYDTDHGWYSFDALFNESHFSTILNHQEAK
jgi:hypothetical protein